MVRMEPPLRSSRTRRGLTSLLLVVLTSGCAANASPSPSPAVAAVSAQPSVLQASPSPAATAIPMLTPEPTPTPHPAPTATPSAWNLTWSDEFDGAAGSPPNAANWNINTGDGSGQGLPGWGNQERETYAADPGAISLDGKGHLVITVRKADGSQPCYYGPCEYTSGKIDSRKLKEVQYGKVEARIKVPAGFGIWPAFWMLGNDIYTKPWPACGEIDVMENVGRWPNTVLGTLHGPGYYGSSGLSGQIDLKKPVAAAFHTFAVEWSPAGIVWTVDGVAYHHATSDDVRAGTWVFDHPFYFVLNVAVGGNLGGLVDPKLPLPASMTVDYVRIYEAVP